MNHSAATRALAGLCLLLASVAGASENGPCDLSEPPPGPLVIDAGVLIIDVFQLSDVEQQFTADLVGLTRWQDPRLATCPEPSLDELWRPTLSLTNRRVRATMGAPHVGIDGTQVVQSQRFTGQLSVRLDLRDFPFDRQLLVVEGVLVDAPANAELRPASDLSGARSTATLAGWVLGAGRIATASWDVVGGLSLPSVRYELEATRNSVYFGWKVILPMVVILLMSWGVFWIPAGNFPTQVSVATTSVLTLFAYQFALSNVLPRVAYLTRMDQFSLGATVLVLFGFCASLVIGRLVHAGKEEPAGRLGRICRWAFPIAMATVLAAAFLR